MKIVEQGAIYKGKPNTGYAKTCFPWLAQLSNGDLLASFQAASVKNGIDSKAVICRSVDGGRTWTEPVNPFDPRVNGSKGVIHLAYITELSPGKLVASVLWCDHFEDPELEFFNPETGGLLPTELCLAFSDDFGSTWSKLRRLEKGDLEGTPAPAMGPIHNLGNGHLICPFETSKPYDDPGQWIHKAAYFISHDNGRIWPEYKVIKDEIHRLEMAHEEFRQKLQEAESAFSSDPANEALRAKVGGFKKKLKEIEKKLEESLSMYR